MKRSGRLGYVFSLSICAVELQSADIARLIVLCICWTHLLGKPTAVLLNELSGGFDDPFRGAEVMLKTNLRNSRVAPFKSKDVLNVTSAPLIDCLIIVSNHA